MSRQQLFATPSDVVIPQKLCDIVNQYAQNLIINQSGSGSNADAGFGYNEINVTDNISSSGNTVNALQIFMGLNGSAVDSARQALLSTLWLVQPTSASNPNRFYVAGTNSARAVSGDGGGAGTEKGAMFGGNDVVTLAAAATHMAACVGREMNIGCETGSSVLDKYLLSFVQLSTDAVSGSRNDSCLLFANQSGAVGWGASLLQMGDGINAAPLKMTGSVLIAKGSQTIANGFDFTNVTCNGAILKAPSGSIFLGNTGNGTLGVQHADTSLNVLFCGTTKGIRFGNTASNSTIEGVDNTGVGSFQPLAINGSTLALQSNGGTEVLAFDASSPPLVKFSTAGAWTANGSVATTMTSLGPTGSHTTIQEWFTVKNSSGTVRYIPAF